MATWTQSRVTCVAIFYYIQMSRKLKAHPVERLIDGYLSKFAKTSNTRGSKQVMQKAAKLIGIALHNPCCQPAEEVILGLKEDYLLVQLVSMLNGIDARKWRESLERAKKSLEDKLVNPCCCEPLTLTMTEEQSIPENIGRGEISVSLCDAIAVGNDLSEPDILTFLVNELNANKGSMPGTFVADSQTRTISYVTDSCDFCNTASFNVQITGG